MWNSHPLKLCRHICQNHMTNETIPIFIENKYNYKISTEKLTLLARCLGLEKSQSIAQTFFLDFFFCFFMLCCNSYFTKISYTWTQNINFYCIKSTTNVSEITMCVLFSFKPERFEMLFLWNAPSCDFKWKTDIQRKINLFVTSNTYTHTEHIF